MIRSPITDSTNMPVELTPLIDIVFIVTVFLLLTANSRLLFLPVDIPQSESQLQQQSSVQTSTITLQRSTPKWAINKQTYPTWSEFKPALLEHIRNNNDSIMIAPARDVDAESLVQLLALLNEQQVTNTQILMEKKL